MNLSGVSEEGGSGASEEVIHKNNNNTVIFRRPCIRETFTRTDNPSKSGVGKCINIFKNIFGDFRVIFYKIGKF